MHYSICKALGTETADKWYTHVPKPVYEEGDVTVLWNQAVNTDREVTANKPDIIIKNKKEKICTLIEVAITADRNVVRKEAEKKLKYKSLTLRRLMSYIYGAPILDVSRSHTTTQHSR